MDLCTYAGIIIPLLLINTIATTSLFLLKFCRKKPVDIYEEDDTSSEEEDSEEDLDEDLEEECAQLENIGAELLASTERLKRINHELQNYVKQNGSPDVSSAEEASDLELIAQIRSVVVEEIESQEQPPKSIESMAGTLISATKNIAGALDGATHIPADKKRELANLLQGVPEFISKITKMDEDELGTILKRNTPSELTVVSKSHPTIISNAVKEDHIKESEFLMQTLDSLRR